MTTIQQELSYRDKQCIDDMSKILNSSSNDNVKIMVVQRILNTHYSKVDEAIYRFGLE